MKSKFLEIDKFGKKIFFSDALENDWIFKTIEREENFYESELLEWLLLLNFPKGDFIDAGTFIGNHTLFFALILEKKVWSFEPNKKSFDVFLENINKNKLQDRVITHNFALGDKNSSATIEHLDDNNLGTSFLKYKKNGAIKVHMLDSVIPSDTPISLIKIDVEGFEFNVLKGAKNTINKNKPLLLIECMDQIIIHNTISYLKRLDYIPISIFGATPLLVFCHQGKVKDFFYDSVPDFYNEYKIYKTENQKIRAINEKYKTLSENLKTIKNNLEDAQKKYRQATNQISDLKEKLQIEVSKSNRIEEVSKVVQKQYNIDIDALKSELTLQNEQSKIAEKNIQELQKKLIQTETLKVETEKNLAEHLEDARKKYRQATNQISDLKEQLLSEVSKTNQIENALKSELTLRDKTEKNLTEQLEDAREKYKQATNEVSHLKEQLLSEVSKTNQIEDALNSELTSLNDKNKEYEKSLNNARENINNINLKYRHQVNEVVPYLKKEINRLNFNQKKTETDYKYKLEQSKQKTLSAEQQISKIRSTLSFQVGYQIVHAFKPWNNIFLLPKKLWKIKHQFSKAQKEKKKNNKQSYKPETPKNPVNSNGLNKKVIDPVRLSKDNFLNFSDIKIACVMDEFTFSSYAPECKLCPLTPNAWKKEIENFQPEVLFIESAWRGKDDQWGNKVGHNAQELQDIIQWCRGKEIPTLFWNKEDPVHFETFLNTAQQFDYVFTTDIDCIHRYKSALGHDRVYLLPFAAQPKVNNPLEKFERKDAFCFAGAYYVRYPERTRDLGNFVSQLSELKPFEIYDRNYGKDDPNYMFPDEYQPFIVGTLKHNEIDKAYKGYNYAINLNSIKHSQTMFARRVYELLASNTITISNYSRGVRLLFGDLVFTSDSGEELIRRLKKLISNDIIARKFRLSSLRKVMKEHTYQDRLAYILSKLQNSEIKQLLPNIALISYAKTNKDLEKILENFNRQSYEYKKLYIVVPKNIFPANIEEKDIVFILEKNAKKNTIKETIQENLISSMVSDDYYGKNYLMDLALATRYSDVELIGKASHYKLNSKDEVILENSGLQYANVNSLQYRSCLVKKDLIVNSTLVSWIQDLEKQTFKSESILSIDEFNYCLNGMRDTKLVTTVVNDLDNIDTGIQLEELINRSEKILPLENLEDKAPVWDATTLSNLFKTPKNKNVELQLNGNIFDARSNMLDGKHDYVYAREDYKLSDIGFTEKVKLYLDTTPGLNIQVVVLFLDAQNQRISHAVKVANRNQEVVIPIGTEKIRFGLRFYGTGSAVIKALVLGHRPTAPAEVIGQGEHLVLTNHYPSYDNIYRNGFVHSRIKAYAENSLNIDVFRLRKNESLSYHEFQNIDVVTGSQEALRKILSSSNYKTVLVHFLDEAMWEILKEFIDKLDVIVWIHGAEIQPWHRRDFNYNNEETRNDAKKKSDIRMAFWSNLLKKMPKRLKLVFVSKYSANTAMEDIGCNIPKSQYRIIHNVINTKLFKYDKKLLDQRKRILSIRPYASRIYANDLSVETILLLSKQPWFNELEFKLIGDGPLFEETLNPLKEFNNVTIEKGFLKQNEIASIHKNYGIFLVPSRMDSQGVSRDEAMSSGLVPVTNAVAAIPEFVDKTCGVLAPSEDAQAMADGIEKLYHNSNLFENMSENAAKRVRSQTSPEYTIKKEIELIRSIEEENGK